MVGQAQAERGPASAEEGRQVDVSASLEDDGQAAGPEAIGELLGGGCDNRQATDLLERVDQELDALLGGALLGRDEALYAFLGGQRGNAVDGLGGDANDLAPLHSRSGLIQRMR